MDVPADKMRGILMARPVRSLAKSLTVADAKRRLRHAEIIVH